MESEKKHEEKETFEERIEKLKREGEQFENYGWVKTDGFEKSIAFFMTLTENIFKMASKHKSFRMELVYNAETFNTYYFFFVPIESESDCKNLEHAKD